MTPANTHAGALACAECDLLIRLQPLRPGDRADCPQCGHRLVSSGTDSLSRILALGIAATVLAMAAMGFDFLSFSSRGQANTMTLFQSASWFFIEDHPILGGVVTLTLFLIPAGYLLGMLYIAGSLKRNVRPVGGALVLRWVMAAGPWVLTDVYLLAALVSLVKIVGMADVSLGLSFWAYMLFCIATSAMTASVNPHRLWGALEEAST